MKLLSKNLLMATVVVVSGIGYIVGCTKKDSTIVPIQVNPPFEVSHGDAVHLPGNMTATNPDEWKLDKVHSSALWSTNYVGAAGLLTGRFNQFCIHELTSAEMKLY
jgi:hypothetical protein